MIKFGKNMLLLMATDLTGFIGLSTLYQIQSAVFSAVACWDNPDGLLIDGACYQKLNETTPGDKLDVSGEASTIFSQYLLIAGLTSIITLAFLGRGVDVLGRRFPLYLSMVGTALSCFAFLAFYTLQYPFRYFIVGAVLQGLSGGGPGFALSMWTMTADISERSNRVANFAYMEASIFIGNLIGTLIAGQLLSFAGIDATLIFTISLSVIVCVGAYFLLRNLPRHASLGVKTDKIPISSTGASAEAGASATEAGTADAAKLASTGAVSYASIMRDMTRASWWTRGKINVIIFFVGFGLAYTIFNLTPVFLQYLPHINAAFWTPSTVGLFLSSQWLCRSLYLVVTPIILHHYFANVGAKRDVWVVRIALFSYTLSSVLYGIVYNEIAYFFINLIDGFGCLAVVTCRGLILHSIENPDLFGRIGSLVAIVETAVTLASPPLFTFIFAETVDVSFDGTAFMVAGSFTALAMLLTLFVDTHAVDSAHHHQQEDGFGDDSASAPLLTEDLPASNGYAAAK